MAYSENEERIVMSQRAYVQMNNERVSNYQRQYCIKTTGNGLTVIGEVIRPRIRNGQVKT